MPVADLMTVDDTDAGNLGNLSQPVSRVARSGGVLAPEEEMIVVDYIGNCVTYR